MREDVLESGDPILDRRYAYAMAAAREGDFLAAAEVLAQTLERAPRWAAAWFALGEAKCQLADRDGAGQAFAAALALDPQDRLGAAPRLAQCRGETPKSLPPAYVARLFDDYAPRFEAHLTGPLAYRGPQVMLAALDAALGPRRYATCLDIGCGTGLAGALLRRRVDRLLGVDLSAAMVAKARIGGNYDQLEVGEAGRWLAARQAGGATLVVAADVLVYCGDLAPILGAAAQALAPGGAITFTCESGPSQGYALGPALRYAHATAYVEDVATQAGLALRTSAPAATRREAGGEVAGRVFVFVQP